jgi:hypothetical protein
MRGRASEAGAGQGLTSPSVPTIYIRDCPDELNRRVRIAAAHEGVTQKALILQAIERECERIEAKHGR